MAWNTTDAVAPFGNAPKLLELFKACIAAGPTQLRPEIVHDEGGSWAAGYGDPEDQRALRILAESSTPAATVAAAEAAVQAA